jgi:hypothetical protein
MLGRRALLGGMAGALLAPAAKARDAGRREDLLASDDFRHGLSRWAIEAERGGRFVAKDGVLTIDSPAGVTLWFRRPFAGPVAIEYEVWAVSAGGPNDAVSDINCFWMARDPAAPGGVALARPRSGAFADYDTLQLYYASLGGNRNTSSRFRRYVGRAGERPLLPQHDRSAPADLIQPNRAYRIRLEADGPHVALLRDGVPLFTLCDPAPYRAGHFGLRTTASHIEVRDFRVLRLRERRGAGREASCP